MKRVKEIVLAVSIGFFTINSINAMENPSTINNTDPLRFLSYSIEEVDDAIFDFCLVSGCQYELVTEPTTFKNYLKVLKLSSKNSNLIDIKYNYLQLKERYKNNSEKSGEIENAYENIMRILLDINDIGETDKGAFHKCILHLSYMLSREVQMLIEKNELKNFFHLLKDASDNEVIAAYDAYMNKYKEDVKQIEKKINKLKAKLSMAKVPQKSHPQFKKLVNKRKYLTQRLQQQFAEKDYLKKTVDKISEEYHRAYPKKQ